jgi:hypothetical protein
VVEPQTLADGAVDSRMGVIGDTGKNVSAGALRGIGNRRRADDGCWIKSVNSSTHCPQLGHSDSYRPKRFSS